MTTIPNIHEPLDQLAAYMDGSFGRITRSVAYLVIATLLLQANTYAIHSPFYLSLGIGALGLTSRSAKIGQFGLAILLLMALFPSGFVANLINQ